MAASKSCIRIWEDNPDEIKIGCLPAVIVPWKFSEIMKKSEKRILVDACAVQCGKKLFDREGMTVELTLEPGVKKVKKLPPKGFEEEVHKTIQKEVNILLGKNLLREEKK